MNTPARIRRLAGVVSRCLELLTSIARPSAGGGDSADELSGVTGNRHARTPVAAVETLLGIWHNFGVVIGTGSHQSASIPNLWADDTVFVFWWCCWRRGICRCSIAGHFVLMATINY